MKGKFITVEGGEGSGKSTFVRELCQRLPSHLNAVATFEPGGTLIANDLRKIFANSHKTEELDPLTSLFIVSACRSQHCSQFIKPELERGNWVVSDRFIDSTRVYQGLIENIDAKLIEAVLAPSCHDVTPDITFVLDCDPEIARARVQNRTLGRAEVARYDELDVEKYIEIQQGFLNLALVYHDRIVVLDANQPLETVIRQACNYLLINHGVEISKSSLTWG